MTSLIKIQEQVDKISLEIRTLTQKIIFKPISVVEIERQKKQLTEVQEELNLYQKEKLRNSSRTQSPKKLGVCGKHR